MLLTGISTTESYLQFITVLILFVFVLGITYATTKWIAGYQKNKMASGNLEVIETLRITGNKYVQIVRAGNKYLVIAIGKDEIHMLSELSEEEIAVWEKQPSEVNFGNILDKIKKQNGKDND
ncbi:MAG: flagellar biosynthetic protein FliO [Lachnospiraceae bacterium]|nr:flagellar biosynthetic protein FliO [Lachnospiraceae bacterium]